MTCITGRNASRPASLSTAITSQSRSGLSWPSCRPRQGFPLMAGRLGRVVMAETRRADAGPTLYLRPPGDRISHTR
jgi:hypothetical protein